MNLTPIHEDEELDEMGGFDSGNFSISDTLDEVMMTLERRI